MKYEIINGHKLLGMPSKQGHRIDMFISKHYHFCSECNRRFVENDTVYLGFTKNRRFIRVGDCCLNLIKRYQYETQIFPKLPYFISDDEAVLWHYMDFAKFLSLLQTKSLFFLRADKFEDPFEGAKCRIEDKFEYEKWFKNQLLEKLKNDHNFDSEDEINRFVEHLIENEQSGRSLVTETFISCWHENNDESIAMWNLYTSSLKYGIAIKTTYEKLYSSLKNVEGIKIGKVNYHALKKDNLNKADDVLWFKLNPYKHEQEVRAIFEELNTEEKVGKLIPVKLDLLIDNVYLSPSSEPWFEELVLGVMKKYGFNKEIKQSDLRNVPYR